MVLFVISLCSIIANGAVGIGPESAFTHAAKTNTTVEGWNRKVSEGLAPINVKWYGAKGDGIADDTLSLSNSLKAASASGSLFLPKGTYKVTKSLQCTSSVIISGETGTILDFSSATLTGSDLACVAFIGQTSSLPALSVDVLSSTNTVSFASAHGLNAGDVFILCDQEQYSYSKYRPYYYQGEYLRVLSVSSSTNVVTTSRTFGKYPPATTVCTKFLPITVRIDNLKLS